MEGVARGVLECNPEGPRVLPEIRESASSLPSTGYIQRLRDTCGAAQGLCPRTGRLFLAFKTTLNEQQIVLIARARPGRGRGRGAGVGGGVGEIGRQALPGSSREGRIRFCCRHREELSVFSALLSPCLSLLLPPSLPSREVQAAGAAAAGRAAGSGQRWAPSFCPFLHPFRAFVAAPTSISSGRQPGRASDSRQVQQPGGGLQGGHVSSGEEEHPAHHGKPPPPALPRCFVAWGWSPSGSRPVGGGDSRGAPGGFLRRREWGGARFAEAAPSPSGDNEGEPRMAGRGWSLRSLSPRACSPLPPRDVPGGWRGREGCGAEQKREGLGVPAHSLGLQARMERVCLA